MNRRDFLRQMAGMLTVGASVPFVMAKENPGFGASPKGIERAPGFNEMKTDLSLRLHTPNTDSEYYQVTYHWFAKDGKLTLESIESTLIPHLGGKHP